MITHLGYFIGLSGMWLFCDGWFSLALYIGRPEQRWIKDHLIRIIRMGIGAGLAVVALFVA